MEKTLGTVSHNEKREPLSDKIEIITITDTHNDFEAIVRNLRVHELVDEKGEWKEGVKNVQIVHTGDVVNKKNPDKKSLEYIFHLQQTAPESCAVKVLTGNHELDFLMKSKGKAEEGSERKLIEGMTLVEVVGPALFLHGYPTRKLLKWIFSYVKKGSTVEEAVREINLQFSEALEESGEGYNNKLSHFLFGDKKPEDKTDLGHKTEHIEESKPLFRKTLPVDYYKIHGPEVTKMLKNLGIDTVIHGHVRSPIGEQTVGEFAQYLPGITMISNDVAVSEFKSSKEGEAPTGNIWGSTKLNVETNDRGRKYVKSVMLINKNTVSEEHKKTLLPDNKQN